MRDRNGMNRLADALRALPPPTSSPDLWPSLAHSLQARRRRLRLRRVSIAAAAVLALLALLPARQMRTVPEATTTVAATATTDGAAHELASLRQRSQTLERWISATQAPVDGGDLMATVEIEDLIGLVDLQLGAARGDADALVLWRQRIDLLEDLATLRSRSSHAIAAN